MKLDHSNSDVGDLRRTFTGTLRLFLALAFVVAGLAKLFYLPLMMVMFATLGDQSWIPRAVAALEFLGAFFLVVPHTIWLGIAILAIVATGAVSAQLFFFEGSLVMPATLLGLTVLLALERWHRSRRISRAHLLQ
ncbi:hypothetical protein ROJ8625_03718 [Roseivivax jejudonensis]|uniref:DoxX n=1 Tax=Roseivivax jejudonensis TaxID=1529041 RepID=A0A1X7A5W5_9RHOB|nr:DoxX family protein [Roseivivax jejudonensis]SLN71356.1 hypothetical protein ROJ8625_03718 [Roseivivax jejudonensis]